MLYGVSPMANTTGKTYQLEPVMRLTTKVIAVRNVAAHEAVGYSGRWQSEKPTQ